MTNTLVSLQLTPNLASEARRDDDFRSLSADPEFLAITQHEKE